MKREQVQNYCYLDSKIIKNCKCKLNIKSRIAQGKSAFRSKNHERYTYGVIWVWNLDSKRNPEGKNKKHDVLPNDD